MKFKDFRTSAYVFDMIEIYINQDFVDTIDTGVTKYDELDVSMMSVDKGRGYLEAYLYIPEQSDFDFI